MRTAKTLIRLGGCPGWSESALGAGPLVGFLVSFFFSLYTLNNRFFKQKKFLSTVYYRMLILISPLWKSGEYSSFNYHSVCLSVLLSVLRFCNLFDQRHTRQKVHIWYTCWKQVVSWDREPIVSCLLYPRYLSVLSFTRVSFRLSIFP